VVAIRAGSAPAPHPRAGQPGLLGVARPRRPRVGQRRQRALDLLPEVLEAGRQADPLAQVLGRLVGRESRADGRDRQLAKEADPNSRLGGYAGKSCKSAK